MTADQAATLNRYEMAQRLGYVERVALMMNIGKLPFQDEKLAKAMGLEVKDLDELPINPVAVNVVFDALSESKSSMLPPDVITRRRAQFFTDDGSVNELAFTLGLLKARLHIKYILIRFVSPRLSWPACRTRLASARASPAGMTPEAPWQPLLGR